ncbi:fumarylacetoacetate hydrolase [Auriscalpium vulgare]|uniref:Fumarylacetoacetate hydrolase n=1 Tax=Auriscalpium vulgare TaxID=40419 RepID=A0ACB8SBJ9_9AGAM|nr:fumarylacetoacetate hydrolase [Auriscalpium vulgare]
MSPIRTQWTRLIRFVAAETSQVHVGQPIDGALDVGLAYRERRPVKAYEITGSALDPAAQVSSNVLTVKTLLSPLSREQIKTVRCLGLNYSDHAAEANMTKPAAPVLFYKPPTSVIGPGAAITIPKAAQPVDKHIPDYEVELTIVIGKAAKNVSEADALDYVLGYTAGNDVSFRFYQFQVSQWGFSKSFDNTNPIGPCLVSASAIPDPQTLPLKATVNGQTLQDGTTADQIFTVKQTIAHLSQGTTLEPGTIILTGTPKGVGFVRKPPVFLKDGDDVQVWIGAGIGTLANPVVEEGKSSSRAKL